MANTNDRCADCAYFSWREHIPEQEIRSHPYDPPDGHCSKIFPRGYVGAGKPGGNVFHGKHGCFQFEKREDINGQNQGDQISLWEGAGSDLD